ncbi:MAG: hypothetical protein AAF581_13355 [Planctomycetota bacterium]
MRVFLALVLLLPCAAANASVPQLAAELPLPAAHKGGEVVVYGRLESLVGSTVRLEGGPVALNLPSHDSFPILRDADIRSRFLEVRIAVQRAAGGPQWIVSEVSKGAPPQAYYERRRAEFSQSTGSTSLSVIAWGKGVVAADSTETALAKLLQQDLSQCLNDISQGQRPTPQLLSQALALLGTDRTADSTTLLRLAEKHGGHADIAKILQQHGLVRTAAGWRLEQEYLAQFRMTRHDEQIITQERATLLEQMSQNHRAELSVTILRSRSNEHYAGLAAEKKIAKGMTRKEIITACGYPESVTWVREGARYYEAWFYNNTWICFADGYAFASS